ncbi:hypothetical protein SADUNF_Sadunf16G0044700 [Salix dunnii]|uniref:Phytocyanin domain-containing protein n=1 Tax=Salix dunnii TaxID=1413687 RepID=A0A835J7X4_9ROSI|nr:hypothetical protein SADUNF_Sadunf16G0044700 [Salix dunnii]
MALKKNTLAISFLMVALCGVSMAAVYQAGDSAGWTSMGQVDYKEWASNKNFHVGDTLVFNYNNHFHNVKQVTQQGFESCNATSPIATYSNGSDTVTLEKHGHFYFICGYPGHCQAGQKIDISVVPATSNLSPARPPTQSSLSSASSLHLFVPSILLSWAFVKNSVAISFLMMALCGVCMAAVYQAGDSAGWTSMGQVDYEEWASNKNFHVGDTLVFNYNNQFHNVKQVTKQGFESCNATSPIATYSNGSDTVTLEKHGHFYFICGYPGHCQAGQKIDISVVPATSNLSPARPPTQSSPSSALSLSLFVPSILLSWAFETNMIIARPLFLKVYRNSSSQH